MYIAGVSSSSYIILADTIYNEGLTDFFIANSGIFTHISKSELKSSIILYPNPVSNKLNFKLTDFNIKTIQIFDITAKLIYENYHYANESIDTKNFENGLYFLKFNDGNESIVRKFIVQH